MGRAVRYLLVEDDDDHATLIERSIRRASPASTVDRVADGAAALGFLRGEPPFDDRPRPDLVLLDLKLPGLTGFQVLQNIKADQQLCTLPVVVLTTSSAESDRVRAYQFHVNSYLVKPMDFTGFQNLVTDLCHYWGTLNLPSDERI